MWTEIPEVGIQYSLLHTLAAACINEAVSSRDWLHPENSLFDQTL